MKAILLMFDSLNRHFLPPYGCDWVRAPNFRRLAERTVTFDTAYVGSMPCMPARREIHTGRYNFLHRGWGPLEPFDDSMPQMLHRRGVYSHLVSDHYHYWEDGGATYHNRYKTWECVRGQEGDPFVGQVADPAIPPAVSADAREGSPLWRQDWVNRAHLQREEDLPLARTVAGGLEFLRRNHQQDNWFLHVEAFDPHEPFFVPKRFQDLYGDTYAGPHFDWPPYREVRETPEQVRHIRLLYAALMSMCDEYLGKVLDAMDELDLWKDTMLLVNTDHGHGLGEHGCWGKCWFPFYEEVAHMPLFAWDPRCGARGQRRGSLVQTIDLAPTLLEFFGIERTGDMMGKPLRETIASDAPVREAALFGVHGGHVNVTDGRYVYMRAAAGGPGSANAPLYQYTLMPTHMRGLFSVEEMRTAQLAPPFAFTKGCPTLRIACSPAAPRAQHRFPTALYDVQADPHQERPIQDAAIERQMIETLAVLLRESDAPKEQFERMGL